MKILFVSSLYPPVTKGGAEISAHLTAKALRVRGHDVSVITGISKGEAGASRRVATETDGVPVVRLAAPLAAKPLLEKAHSRRMAEVLATEIGSPGRFDIIHAHDYKSALVLSELGFKNTVVTVRDYAQICGTTNNILYDGSRCTCSWRDVLRSHRVREVRGARRLARIWQYKFNVGYRRRAFRKIPAHIYISRAQRREVLEQQNLSGLRHTVIYNPVADDYLREPIREGTTGEVLYVGRVEMYKGVGLLLAAWQAVSKYVPSAHLSIIGEGEQRKDYETMMERNGLQYRTEFRSPRQWNRMRPAYDRAQIVASPHLWTEPFGRTAAEAMARGKVVVAADTGGPAEIIEHEKSGLLFKTGDHNDLEDKLTEALTMPDLPRHTMQKAAQGWAARNLNAGVIAARHEQFYQQLG